MSNDTSFSWLAFLLGLAIGLWISIVAFFLIDHGDDCDCGPGGTTIIASPGTGLAWIPGGNGDYFCTNDDEGSAIVVDEGSAVVADEGSAIVVDEGGAIVVDEGSAVVADTGGFVPAPGSGRKYQELRCNTNDEGGAIVVDRSGRVVVTAMLNSEPSERCGRLNGNAVVVNGSGKKVLVDEGGAIVVDEGSAIVADESAASGNDQELDNDSPLSDTDLAYCVVAKPDSQPIVIRPPESP